MKFLDLTLASPAGNLAGDEALLNWGEAGGGEVLRFWEPCEYFVVVGYANKVETEVNVPACAARKMPIFRRCSGGGTVLQGPGCLNYALVLQITSRPSLANISSANKFIMERNREAVQSAMAISQVPVSVCGYTDLALAVRYPLAPPNPPAERGIGPTARLRKFSGNSQRRHKRALLFHGTFLLNFNLSLINEVLRMPSRQPDYRQDRGHDEFLANLNLSATRLKRALGTIWEADEGMHDFPASETQELVRKKYSTRKWNFKL